MNNVKNGITEVLSKLQKELKAPKSQYNSFAKFHYRNCEDILEAIKKIMPDGVSVTLEDKVVKLGDRFYVKATATIWVGDSHLECSAYARESYDKKGMDSAQITGAASSYARKYALNGLFLIDDSKDADSRDNKEDQPQVRDKGYEKLRHDVESEFDSLVKKLNISNEIRDKWYGKENVTSTVDLSYDYLNQLIAAMKMKLAEKNNV